MMGAEAATGAEAAEGVLPGSSMSTATSWAVLVPALSVVVV